MKKKVPTKKSGSGDNLSLDSCSGMSDHFFDAGDKRNKAFWTENSEAVDLLGGQYVEIEA